MTFKFIIAIFLVSENLELLQYLPSRRYGMLLACISVMCVKPMSATASRLLADTLAANDLKDVSVRIPAPIALPGTTMEKEMNVTFRKQI